MIRSGGTRARSLWACRVFSRLGCAVLAAGLLLQGCDLGKPQVPTTEWAVRLPVADYRTTIQEVVQGREEYLTIDEADNSMQFAYTHILGVQQELGERLRLPGLSPDPFETGVGEIKIPAQTLPDFTFKMSQMMGQDEFDQLSLLGTVPLVPASDINQVSDLALRDTERLLVRDGGIEVTIENGLPLPLALELELLDREQGDKVVSTMTGLPDQIAPNAEESGVFDLAGVEISGNLAIRVVGGTLEAKDVNIVGDPELVIKSAIETLIVDEATAKIDPLTLAAAQTIPFPTQMVIVKSAAIKEGSIDLRVTNNIPVGIDVVLALNDLRDANGNIIEIPLNTLVPNGSTVETINLDNTTFTPDPDNPDNEERTHLSLSYSASTKASDGVVEITSEGASISVAAALTDLVFDEINGKLNNLNMDQVPSIEQQIPDVPDGLENIKFESTSLVAFLTSRVGFQSQIELQIEGSNPAGLRDDFTVQETFERYDSGVDPETGKEIAIELDPEDLTDFLNLLPDEITVTPNIKVGDGLAQESVSSTDWVRVDSVIFGSMPRFEITADDYIELPPQYRDIADDEARQRTEDNLEGLSVRTVIENHIPLAVRVRVFVGATEGTVYTDPLFTIETDDGTPFGVEAAPVDERGRTTNSTLGAEQIIRLSQLEAKDFLREGGFWTGIRVEFDQTDSYVEVLGSDWISIKVAAEVIIEFNDSLIQ